MAGMSLIALIFICVGAVAGWSAPYAPTRATFQRCTVAASAAKKGAAAAAVSDAMLRPGAAVEVWHEGGLSVGNFRGRAEGSKALIVELSSGRSVKVGGDHPDLHGDSLAVNVR